MPDDITIRRRVLLLKACLAVDDASMARRLKMSRCTLWRRLKHPDTFTVAELRMLEKEERKVGIK